MAHAVAGLAEHVGQDELDLVATSDEMQAVLPGKGGKQAVACASVLGRGQEVFPSEPATVSTVRTSGVSRGSSRTACAPGT